MNKFKISSLVIALSSSFAVMADINTGSYSSFGISQYNIERENTNQNLAFDQSITTVDIGYGYRFTKNISFELNFGIPTDKKVLDQYVDSFRNFNADLSAEQSYPVYDDVQLDLYERTLDPKYFANLGVKLDLPLHNKFDIFIFGGYMVTQIDHQNYYTDDISLDFINSPHSIDTEADFLAGNSTGCSLSGNETICGTPVQELNEEFKENGLYYGAGLRFYYTNQTTLSLSYKQSEMDLLEIDGITARIEYKF